MTLSVADTVCGVDGKEYRSLALSYLSSEFKVFLREVFCRAGNVSLNFRLFSVQGAAIFLNEHSSGGKILDVNLHKRQEFSEAQVLEVVDLLFYEFKRAMIHSEIKTSVRTIAFHGFDMTEDCLDKVVERQKAVNEALIAHAPMSTAQLSIQVCTVFDAERHGFQPRERCLAAKDINTKIGRAHV